MLLAAAAVQAQDLPDGAGKDLVMNVCTVCHELTRITSKKKTKDEWNDTVDKMAARGAKASDEEFDTIVNYLTKYFGKDQASEKSSWQPFPLRRLAFTDCGVSDPPPGYAKFLRNRLHGLLAGLTSLNI